MQVSNKKQVDAFPAIVQKFYSTYSQELKVNLSIAIAHVLSIKSVAASNAAGQANAVKSALMTVIIAPCFISSIAIPNANQSNIDIIHFST